MQRKNFAPPRKSIVLADAKRIGLALEFGDDVEVSGKLPVILVRMPGNAKSLKSFVNACNYHGILLRECRPRALAQSARWENVSPVDYVSDPSGPLGTRAIASRPDVDCSPWREAIGSLESLQALVRMPCCLEWAYVDSLAHAPDARGQGQTKKPDSHSHDKHK